MTAPRVGETFHLDLDGMAIAGRYIEVDPPHRMLLSWDRQRADTTTPTATFIEITLTPTGRRHKREGAVLRPESGGCRNLSDKCGRITLTG